MIYFKKLEKLVNMIKKFSLIFLLFLLVPLKSYAFSEQNEQQMYIGCYQNSKQYLGADKAKTYCQCTVNKLSEKFSDDELDRVFKQKPEDIIKDTEFASKFCENKILQ
jgi:hypothetical protein